jgi:hypothetical protein
VYIEVGSWFIYCSWYNRSLVRLADKNNQSESWFCRNCSIEFNPNDEQVSHKQKLTIPYQDSEPAVASIGVTPNVSIHHEPELKGGFAALAKKGTIRFTSYQATMTKKMGGQSDNPS